MAEDMTRNESAVFKNDTYARNLMYKAVRSDKKMDASSSSCSDDNAHDSVYEDEFQDWASIGESENWGEFILNSPYNPEEGRRDSSNTPYNSDNIKSSHFEKNISSSNGIIKINEQTDFKSNADKLQDFLISGSDLRDPQ
jgi:hypothetical protein